MLLSDLERKGGLQVLVFLYNWKKPNPVKMSDFRSEISIHGETLISLVDFLAKLQLVEHEHTATFPVRHIVYLTEQGKVVASHLAEAEKALGQPRIQK